MNAIGIDLGGTYVRCARINISGEIEEQIKFPTTKDAESFADEIIVHINELKTSATQGVGIGIPGQVDNINGTVVRCTNLQMNHFPLGRLIEKETGLKVQLNNDANVAALGEAIIGSGSGLEVVYYITWSTGIGGGLVVNGKLLSGRNYYTGEIGNLIIWPDDPYKHSVMNKGGLEGLAAGQALARYSEELGYNTLEEFFTAYQSKEPAVVGKINYVVDTFARGLADVCHVIEPDCFVFGGGVSLKSGDILLPLVKERVNEYVMPQFKNKIEMRLASLGDDNGIIGAALLILREL